MKNVILFSLFLASTLVAPAVAQDTTEVDVAPSPPAITPAPEATPSSPAAKPAPEVAQSSAEVTPAPEAAAQAAQAIASRSVPKLNVTWDCGECEHNERVLPLIEQAYAAEAQKNSFVISETDVAEVAITDIRQRPPGVRVMFGVMAGKDRLGLRIRHNGVEYTVSDTSANAIMGLNYLSQSVGKRAFAQLSAKAGQ